VTDRRRVLAAVVLLVLALALALVTGALGGSSRDSPHPPRRAGPGSSAAAAVASTPSPPCTPSALNRSAVLAGTPLSVSPLPGTKVAEPSTQISLLGAAADRISAISVTSSHTGRHAGRLVAYSQGDGASFLPARPFSPGERVEVRGRLELSGLSRPFAWAFTVAHQDPLPDRPGRFSPVASPTGLYSFHSLPGLRAPIVHVSTQASPSAAPGDIFVTAAASANGPGGAMIFEDSGQLVWFNQLPAKLSAANLQIQQYQGRPVLSWWQGYTLAQGFGEGEEVIASTAYRRLALVHAGNGLLADLHDFQISSQNTGLLTAYDPIHCDLAAIGGPRNGAVTDGVYQEIDLATGLVRREWHALDHVALAEAYPKVEAGRARTAFPYDFFHVNSLDPRPDGSLMISSRNTWAIYILDDRSGQVRTRIGGKQSTVTMGPGTSTAWQHDGRTLPDGDITVFDNGAIPKIHPYSRGILERLDPATNTMALLRQYVHAFPPLSAATQGNVQTLSNGNVLIGWGAEPYVSEYSPAGRLLFDAHMAPPDQSYRAFRFPWSALPESRPALAITTAGGPGSAMAYASWNGATQVSSWRLLGGSDAHTLEPQSTVEANGFETAIPVMSPGPWFEVQALNGAGTVIGSSPPSKRR
jgi:Arylsulfotransferase (ASST)